MKRITVIFFAVFTVANLYWVLSLPLLPFTDLPFHLAESFIVKNFNDSGFLFEKFYVIPSFLKSNTFYTFFCSAGIFPDVETASRIYYALYVILLPLSLLQFIRLLNGNKILAILSFLFVIHYSVHWGFTGYTMSVPVLFLIFSVLYLYFIRRKILYAFAIPPLLLILFTLHFQSAIFAALVFTVMQFVYSFKRIRFWIIFFVTMFPLTVVMYLAYNVDSQGGSSLTAFLTNYYLNDFAGSLLRRFGIFFILDNFFLFKGAAGIVYSAFVSASVIAIFAFCIKRFYKGPDEKLKYVFVLLAVSAACYVFLPDNINGQNIIFERYSVILFLLMIAASGALFPSSKDAARADRCLTVAILIIVSVHSVILLDYMNDFRNESRDFNEEIFPSGRELVLAGVIKDNDFRGRKIWTHFPMYFTVWKGGITTGLVDYKFGLIKRNAPKSVLPQFKEWLDGNDFDFSSYYSAADYIIVRSVIKDSLNNFNLISASGKWKLYRNIVRTCL